MTKREAIKLVRKRYPYAVATENHREVVQGWDIRKVAGGEVIVWGQRSEEAAWLAAASWLTY